MICIRDPLICSLEASSGRISPDGVLKIGTFDADVVAAAPFLVAVRVDGIADKVLWVDLPAMTPPLPVSAGDSVDVPPKEVL